MFVPASCGRTLFVVFNYIYCSCYLFIVLCFILRYRSCSWAIVAIPGAFKLGRLQFEDANVTFCIREKTLHRDSERARMKTSLILCK